VGGGCRARFGDAGVNSPLTRRCHSGAVVHPNAETRAVVLNISLKPRERLVVNGAVIRNKSSRHSLTMEFLNRVNFMREREILMPEQATTPLLRIIYWLQITYIDAEQRSEAQQRFFELAHELKTMLGGGKIAAAIDEALALLQQERFGAALKVLRDALPIERALLDLPAGAVPCPVAEAVCAEGKATGLDPDVREEPA